MSTAFTLLGELEHSQDRRQDPVFAEFDRLPQVDFIRSVADELTGLIELMPYQNYGEEMKLRVSVYLQPRNNSGKVIAVLIRGRYPMDLKEIQQLVGITSNRLSSLGMIADRFEEDSIRAAQEYLDELRLKIKNCL